MAEQPEEETIQRRLQELNSSDWYDRKQAIQALTQQQLRDERILAAVKLIAELDTIGAVRKIAREALGLGDMRPAAPEPKPLTEETLQDLLNELNSLDPERRGSAVQVAGQQQIKGERLTTALQAIAENDPIGVVRQAAQMALAGALPPGSAPKSASKPSAWNSGDFWLGFLGWYLVNILAWSMLSQFSQFGNVIYQYFPVGILLLNIGALIVLAFVRPKAALGVLAAFGVAFVIVLLLGLLIIVTCSVSGSRL